MFHHKKELQFHARVSKPGYLVKLLSKHDEIAAQGAFRLFAETLDLTEAASLLEATLNEEKAADEKLSEVSTSAINIEAAQAEA